MEVEIGSKKEKQRGLSNSAAREGSSQITPLITKSGKLGTYPPPYGEDRTSTLST
jgi:hypothetical protein